MDAVLRDRLTFVAALGAGVVVGISGIYMYYKINRSVNSEITQLARTIENLKREIAELKATSTSSNKSSSSNERNRKTKTLPELAQSANFAPSSMDDEEEFFDFTDTEDVSASWAAVNGPNSSLEQILSSPDPVKWLDQIDAMLDGNSSQQEGAYRMLKDKISEESENAGILWRLAKAAHLRGIVAHKRGELSKKKDLAFEAYDYANKALELCDTDPEVHKWVAITVGSLAEYVGTKQKIQNGYIFKKHVDTAIKLKPLDPTLHHMLGRWCYEIAMLSWIERKAAAALFASPPESTLEECREHLLKCESLKHNWKENLLYIAKSYIGEGEYASAIEWIDKAVDLPNNSEDDELAHAELETLQVKFKDYRS